MCYSALACHMEVIRPVAVCREADCTFHLTHSQDAKAVRDGAKQHAEAAGHPVLVEVVIRTTYTLNQ